MWECLLLEVSLLGFSGLSIGVISILSREQFDAVADPEGVQGVQANPSPSLPKEKKENKKRNLRNLAIQCVIRSPFPNSYIKSEF